MNKRAAVNTNALLFFIRYINYSTVQGFLIPGILTGITITPWPLGF